MKNNLFSQSLYSRMRITSKTVHDINKMEDNFALRYVFTYPGSLILSDSLILLDEPQRSDVENKALNPASVINKDDERSTRTSNQYHENNISELANVVNLSVEKSSSCRGEQLHEIGKLTTNNKTPKELFQQTRKSSIPCPYLLGRGWCIKQANAIILTKTVAEKKISRPKVKCRVRF